MKDTFKYHTIILKLRRYFSERGYIEVPVQSRLSILAACEDPRTVSTFVFDGQSWPLPQTGQMWLEYELLKNPDYKGVYCISTSYRNEPLPIPGRHDKIFPMCEFEGRGNIKDLINLEKDLLTTFNIPFNKSPQSYLSQTMNEITPELEKSLWEKFGNFFLVDFPEFSDPFWNMKRNNDGTAAKVDVILNGVETIGSAERETDVATMRNRFHTISNGEYAGLLYRHFGEERVEQELKEYLSLPMVPRFGGGIGITRLARIF
jgi:aspartyl/asparaginyl-tRNA synthetase